MCILLIGVIFLSLQRFRPPPSQTPQPLANTYQYFHEHDLRLNSKCMGAVSHSDLRFAPDVPPSIEEIRQSLKFLMECYTSVMQLLQVETWIAHGTLLGWQWGQQVLPWDTDIDMQVSAATLKILATKHNMTRHSFQTSSAEQRVFLLDVNFHHSILSTSDIANKIDARWIDTMSGKYVDITAVHNSSSSGEHLFCKDGHEYLVSSPIP